MRVVGRRSSEVAWNLTFWPAIMSAAVFFALPALAQMGGVGGVYVDPEGVLRGSGKRPALAKVVKPELAEAIAAKSDLRRVSLLGVAKVLKKANAKSEPIPEEVRCLAGIHRLDHVILDRKARDVILVGPAEGWLIDPDGRPVGATSKRPTLLLQDLVVALRSVLDGPGSAQCSIDPDPDGLLAMKEFLADPANYRGTPESLKRKLADQMGLQTIWTRGVPKGSHFALAMIDADFRMKRAALEIDKFPGLYSHLDAIEQESVDGTNRNALARWWFTPFYDAVEHDPSRQVFRLVGQAIRLNSEEQMVDEFGRRQGTGASTPLTQKFADSFTEHFPQIEAKVRIFAELRQLFDLMMVAGIVATEGAGDWLMATPLLDNDLYAVEIREQPKLAEPLTTSRSKPTAKGGNRRMVISLAFGGVDIRPTRVLKSPSTPSRESGPLAQLLEPSSDAAGAATAAAAPSVKGRAESDDDPPAKPLSRPKKDEPAKEWWSEAKTPPE